MNRTLKMWIPSLDFVLQVFHEIGKIPECQDISNSVCRDLSGIIGLIDKITYGWIGTDKPTIQDCAAMLIHDIIKYHYFSDGNKRLGFLLLLVFLEKIGYSLKATEDEKVEFTLAIAQDILTFDEIKS